MSLDTWLLYVTAVVVLTVTPGPSVLMCVTCGVNFGARLTLFSALGSITAVLGIMSCSAVGLGTLLAASEELFQVIKWLGVAYLLYVGIGALRATDTEFKLPAREDMPATRCRLFVRGLLVGGSNPKALLFFTAFFPQFIDPSAAQLPQFLILGATFVGFEFCCLMFYASFASRIAPWLRVTGRARLFNRIFGGLFVTAAALLATIRRTSEV